MKLLAIGGDARNGYLASWAMKEGIQARVSGHSGAPEARIQDAEEADIVVLPDARILNTAPYALLGAHLRPDAEIYIYACPDAEEENCGCGRRVINLLKDESYVEANARLTAEGALVRAGELSRGAMLGAGCVVLGYGRIGRALCSRLRALEARCAVVARREEVRRQAALDGAQALPMEEMAPALKEAEFVFNTVPARIVPDALLKSIPQTAAVLDLASAPFGFDLDKALAAGLRASREGGLPGRYCPRTAGRVMLEAVLRRHEEARGHE